MSLLRSLLSRLLLILLPLAITISCYLYLYPVFHGCAFPLPSDSTSIKSSYLNTIRQHIIPTSASDPAIFRLLVLADPQLEGDSSLPNPEDELPSRLRHHWTEVTESLSEGFVYEDVVAVVSNALRTIVNEDIPRALRAVQKRVDLLGNDYYLAHIYRTLHWWTRPSHVTVLGDLIGSQWVTDEEFERRGARYWERVFRGGERVSDDITGEGELGDLPLETNSSWAQRIINIAGNHDIGYSGDVNEARLDRFERVFGRANWDVRFRLDSNDSAVTPTLHLINLNTLTLDGPALSKDIESRSFEYVNEVISKRTYPVEDRTTFTLLLTHLPLHKEEGICTDGPYFTYHEYDDEEGPDGVPRYMEGGLREQNHLSDHVSANGILQGIFGMSGNENAAGGGWGRNGLILNGHDHTGCDSVHYIDTVTPKEKEEGEESQEPEQSWKWNARRYDGSNSTTPSIREVTMRSMMGEFGGYAGLLSIWFDADPAVNEWKYEITMCAAGVQHIWWAVHVIDLVTLVVLLVHVLVRLGFGSGSDKMSSIKLERKKLQAEIKIEKDWKEVKEREAKEGKL